MSIRNRTSLLGLRITIAAAVLFALAAGARGAAAQDPEFTPVTDAMLANPDVADWLSWRRTLDAWGYSPLDQINTDNVHRLQLVWAWRLEPGASQPTPLVYDGVMYIANPNNIIQALDAATGDMTGVVRGLMWAGGSTPFPRTHSVPRTIRRKHTDSIRA